MQGQLTLPGFDASETPKQPAATCKLFLALFPPEAQAQAIAQRARCWYQQHGLHRAPLQPSRLHVTLQVLGDYPGAPPKEHIEAAVAALYGVMHASITTCWDQLLSFPANGAFVLRCDARTDAALAQLRKVVQSALAIKGLGASPSSTAHITLLYDSHRIVTPHRVDPVCWTAYDVALILSHLGQHQHQLLARQPLRAPGS